MLVKGSMGETTVAKNLIKILKPLNCYNITVLVSNNVIE